MAAPIFDRSHLQLALFYLESGNYTDASAELDSLSPSCRTTPSVLALRERCEKIAVEQWRSRAERAGDLVKRFPSYAVGQMMYAVCLRQFEAIRSSAASR